MFPSVSKVYEYSVIIDLKFLLSICILISFIKGDNSLNKMEIEEEKINNEKNENKENKDIMKDN